MPLKKGQKLTDNPRSVRLEIRLTQGESAMLEEVAQSLEVTKTAAIVKGIEAIKAELDASR